MTNHSSEASPSPAKMRDARSDPRLRLRALQMHDMNSCESSESAGLT